MKIGKQRPLKQEGNKRLKKKVNNERMSKGGTAYSISRFDQWLVLRAKAVEQRVRQPHTTSPQFT